MDRKQLLLLAGAIAAVALAPVGAVVNTLAGPLVTNPLLTALIGVALYFGWPHRPDWFRRGGA